MATNLKHKSMKKSVVLTCVLFKQVSKEMENKLTKL